MLAKVGAMELIAIDKEGGTNGKHSRIVEETCNQG